MKKEKKVEIGKTRADEQTFYIKDGVVYVYCYIKYKRIAECWRKVATPKNWKGYNSLEEAVNDGFADDIKEGWKVVYLD